MRESKVRAILKIGINFKSYASTSNSEQNTLDGTD